METYILFGFQPKFIYGVINGSMTGVGESEFGDTVSQRACGFYYS